MAPIQESLPSAWFFRESFSGRSILLYVWLLMASVLAMAYESNLLAILVTIRYDDTIDTAEQLWKSGLKVAVPGETVIHALIASSPNPYIKKLYEERTIVHDFTRYF